MLKKIHYLKIINLIIALISIIFLFGCGGDGGGDDGDGGEGGEYCSSHYEKLCYNGDVYWYDDCGNREELYEECECGCTDGSCDSCGETGDHAPVITSFDFYPDSLTQGEILSVSISGYDEDKDLMLITILVPDLDIETSSGLSGYDIYDDSFGHFSDTAYIDTYGYTPGLYTFEVYVTDEQGNESNHKADSFLILPAEEGFTYSLWDDFGDDWAVFRMSGFTFYLASDGDIVTIIMEADDPEVGLLVTGGPVVSYNSFNINLATIDTDGDGSIDDEYFADATGWGYIESDVLYIIDFTIYIPGYDPYEFVNMTASFVGFL